MHDPFAIRRDAALRFKLSCGETGPGMLDLTHPRFNLREVTKHLVLLEDHCAHPYKHCPDCIRKHLLTIEAFAEEAVSLDTLGMYHGVAESIALNARTWMVEFEDGRDLTEIGKEVRSIRKSLVPLVCDPRDLATRVASRFLASATLCEHRR